MMNQEIRRRIDNARQVLVGKVPDPKSQVEQITTALIYKFMDDMDTESVRLEGNPGFFVNDYEKYSWTKLMNSRLGGQNRLNLYAEAVMNLSQNPHLPQLFRDIFKDAFLPYRDPETLNLFLKEIDGFSYGSTDNLGDAYEYLLSVLGSQGNAGQFLTPRHIIKFIVSIVDPKKNETILDPACGTAGFLILAYLHILEANTEKKPGDLLTPDEKDKLIHNFVGYDIDPGMRRLSLVNMYLHNFSSPHIYEYDTLTNDEKWQDQFDVIMANPPFMSPKGGIRPHKRFAIHANRSEVLFVDYIAEHLNINGRAGVIVPEGIIFQSADAYKSLRKMLIDDYLWAVVSLPAGVFHPYSGVKTSILFMDKKLAKQTDKILFVKIENDGFDLGAQRREIDKNDLPLATDVMNFYKNNIRENKNLELPEGYLKIANVIPKQKIINLGDYNLTGDRYKEVVNFANQKWPMVELKEIADIGSGNSAPQDKELFNDGKYPFFRTSDVGVVHISDNLMDSRDRLNEVGIKGLKLFPKNTILFPKSGASTFLNHRAMLGIDGYVSSHLATITPNENKIIPKFLFNLLKNIDAKSLTNDQNYPSLKTLEIAKIKLPLPPLEVQKQIVQEIEGYQKIIDGARQVVQNWKPTIKIDSKWPMVRVGDICEISAGNTAPQDPNLFINGKYPFYRTYDVGAVHLSENLVNVRDWLNDDGIKGLKKIKKGTILFPKSGASTFLNHRAIMGYDGFVSSHLATIWAKSDKIHYKFLYYILIKVDSRDLTPDQNYPSLRLSEIENLQISLPPLEIQKEIVLQIEEEQKAVDACKKLIELNEQKIKSKISEVWSEE
jgi:type I restriction enzyme M protein